MKCWVSFFVFVSLLNDCFGQTEKKQSLKYLFNEFQISVNHGAASPKTFFGAGIGAGHLFRPDRSVGVRVGLEVDLFHFWDGDITPPYSTEGRRNQHYYSTNVSIPFALRLNFGNRIRFLFELGGRFGVNAHTHYKADVFQTGSNYGPYGQFEHKTETMSLGPFLGLNSGIGIYVPFSEKYSLFLKPDAGLNIYLAKPPFAMDISPIANLYVRMNVGLKLTL